jgi:hypothetical protein
MGGHRVPITHHTSIDEILDEFLNRANSAVYATLATIDKDGWPRTRVIHAVWEGATCWITGFPTSPKRRDLARSPMVSLAYDKEPFTPANAECLAEWVTDLDEKQRVWDYLKSIPAPIGFDPGPIYGAPDDARFGLIRLTPVRIQLYDAPAKYRRWEDRTEFTG